MQYGRMRQRIEDTLKEAKSLEEIKDSFDKFKIKKEEQDYCQYRMNKLDVLKLKSDIHLLQKKIEDGEKELKTEEENETVLEKKLEQLSKEYDALVACFPLLSIRESREAFIFLIIFNSLQVCFGRRCSLPDTVKLCQYALLHLCRSLVGEGYGKYLPVGAWIDYQMLDVFHSQRKGLA